MAGFSFLLRHRCGALMICSLAIAPEIYQYQAHQWRKNYTVFNCIALLFLGQRLTGFRDLLEFV